MGDLAQPMDEPSQNTSPQKTQETQGGRFAESRQGQARLGHATSGLLGRILEDQARERADKRQEARKNDTGLANDGSVATQPLLVHPPSDPFNTHPLPAAHEPLNRLLYRLCFCLSALIGTSWYPGRGPQRGPQRGPSFQRLNPMVWNNFCCTRTHN